MIVDPQVIARGAQWLAAGRLVAFATETVYGLGADASQQHAIEAIYRTKGRPPGHPLIVHVAGVEQACWWAEWPERAERLARAFWPGPLTMILPRSPQAPSWACGGQSTIGLRCPSHPLAHALLVAFSALGGQGVAAPSANRFGRISPTTAGHVREDLAEAVAAGQVLVLDGGASEVGLESTIVDLSRGAPVLLRPGAITPEQLAHVLGEAVTLSANVIDPGTVDPTAPRASGTLASHYAPVKPLVLLQAGQLAAELARAEQDGDVLAMLVFEPLAGRLAESARASGAATQLATQSSNPNRTACAIVESAPDDPREYGQSLYATLRRLDASAADRLVLQAPPRDERWQAVWDRLARAAHEDRD